MRISTTMAFELGVAAINRQQGEILKSQQQLSTGRRLTAAADDPAAAARVIEVSSGLARNAQFMANHTTARNGLALMESTLGQVGEALENIRPLLIQSGNGVNTDRDRAAIAVELQARADYILSLVNTRDVNGAYIFSGYQEKLPAFIKTAGGTLFQGDQGWRELQVSEGRCLPVSASGSAIFERVRAGNGVFETAGAASNVGSGAVDAGQVVDAGLIDGHAYQITFHVSGGVLSYDVADTTLGVAVVSAAPYTPGTSITVSGMQVQLSGTPAEGDRFTLSPSGNSGIFLTLEEAVRLLRTPAQTPATNAQLQMGLARVVAGLDRGLDSVGLARTAAGAGLNELDSLEALADGRDLQYQQALSDLQDVDYARAISDLSLQQTMSDAAQKAFMRVMGRSLFDLL